jgi:hypothetical protein
MWVLVILAVHINNLNDVPARLTMQFPSEQQCLTAVDSLEYDIKFKQFKLEATCSQKK